MEWYKDKKKLSSTFYQTGGSYISDLQLTAVTVSQDGAFECRTTVIPSWYKGYKAKTGILSVTGRGLVCFISLAFMNTFIVQGCRQGVQRVCQHPLTSSQF